MADLHNTPTPLARTIWQMLHAFVEIDQRTAQSPLLAIALVHELDHVEKLIIENDGDPINPARFEVSALKAEFVVYNMAFSKLGELEKFKLEWEQVHPREPSIADSKFFDFATLALTLSSDQYVDRRLHSVVRR